MRKACAFSDLLAPGSAPTINAVVSCLPTRHFRAERLEPRLRGFARHPGQFTRDDEGFLRQRLRPRRHALRLADGLHSRRAKTFNQVPVCGLIEKRSHRRGQDRSDRANVTPVASSVAFSMASTEPK